MNLYKNNNKKKVSAHNMTEACRQFRLKFIEYNFVYFQHLIIYDDYENLLFYT